MERADVSKAFDMVLASIQEALDDLNSDVIHASQNEAFEEVSALADKGKQIIAFREQVLNLQSDWNNTFATPTLSLRPAAPNPLTADLTAADLADNEDTDTDRLSNGRDVPTRQKEDFYVPILHVLLDLGGRAKAEEVLDKLEEAMAFNTYDLEPRSTGIPVRWMHTAHRARHDLVHEKGFLSASSPRGVWEITEAGRNYLARNAARSSE
jgi:hypothetical protein